MTRSSKCLQEAEEKNVVFQKVSRTMDCMMRFNTRQFFCCNKIYFQNFIYFSTSVQNLEQLVDLNQVEYSVAVLLLVIYAVEFASFRMQDLSRSTFSFFSEEKLNEYFVPLDYFTNEFLSQLGFILLLERLGKEFFNENS